jgi:mycothiol system anti-sigma-R factor
MSCGKPHAVACSTVLSMIYVFIDGELDEVHRVEVTTHLAECAPCEYQFAAEVNIKSLVRRSCQHEAAPQELRAAILARIRAADRSVE